MCHLREQFWLLFNQRTQLIQGVKGQKLNAATAVNFTFTRLRHRLRHNAGRAAVTVRDRQTDTLTDVIDQNVIHAPGINADAVYPNAFIADFFQAKTNIVFQAVDVPGVKTVCFLQAVHEAVDFTQRQGAVFTVVTRQHYAPTGCAEIDCDTMAKSHSEVLLSFIALSLRTPDNAYLLDSDSHN